MAQKYSFYVDINHKENGLYTDWNKCAELKAKGGTNFKGFSTKEEAQAFIEGVVLKGSSASDNPVKGMQKENDSVLIAEDNIEELTQEIILQNINNCEKHAECSEEQRQLLFSIAESIKLNKNFDVSKLSADLDELCKIHKDVDAVIFADGSADKDKVTGLSEKLGIGLLFVDIKEKTIQAYEYRIGKDTRDDLDWILKGSNDSAEMIAAISSMLLSQNKGHKKIRIYQDNVRPLSYFYGLFKNLNTEIGVWFIDEAKNCVENMEVRFIYVPAHTKKDGYDNNGKNAYLKKVAFQTAKNFNAAVDDLANVKL